MQCSALNNDLYRKNIVDSPSCQHCGGFESAYHIFFTCPLYATTRRYLPANLHEYSLKDLLYGTENGTSHENETLFLKVLDVLTKCRRFNPRYIYTKSYDMTWQGKESDYYAYI